MQCSVGLIVLCVMSLRVIHIQLIRHAKRHIRTLSDVKIGTDISVRPYIFIFFLLCLLAFSRQIWR